MHLLQGENVVKVFTIQRSIEAPGQAATSAEDYELRFESLFQAGRGYAFPCDAHGSVDLDAMTESARANYLAARALVGREYGCPVVVLVQN